eukprot:5899630-Amphidinium_carterae.1
MLHVASAPVALSSASTSGWHCWKKRLGIWQAHWKSGLCNVTRSGRIGAQHTRALHGTHPGSIESAKGRSRLCA